MFCLLISIELSEASQPIERDQVTVKYYNCFEANAALSLKRKGKIARFMANDSGHWSEN